MLVTVTTPATAQTTNPIFLDCDTVRQYLIPDEGKVVREVLHFKLDFDNSNVLQLDTDRGNYESLCKDDTEKTVLFKVKGSCFFGDEIIYAGGTKGVFTITSVDDVQFYRKTGKIGGSRKTYLGSTRDIIELLATKPVVEYRISGNCQQGIDLSPKKRAF